jgi:hypothetical protein
MQDAGSRMQEASESARNSLVEFPMDHANVPTDCTDPSPDYTDMQTSGIWHPRMTGKMSIFRRAVSGVLRPRLSFTVR